MASRNGSSHKESNGEAPKDADPEDANGTSFPCHSNLNTSHNSTPCGWNRKNTVLESDMDWHNILGGYNTWEIKVTTIVPVCYKSIDDPLDNSDISDPLSDHLHPKKREICSLGGATINGKKETFTYDTCWAKRTINGMTSNSRTHIMDKGRPPPDTLKTIAISNVPIAFPSEVATIRNIGYGTDPLWGDGPG